MNFSNISMETVMLAAAIALGVICLISIILSIVTLCKLKKLRRRVDALTRGKNAESMETRILEFFERIEDLESHEQGIEENIQKIKENLKITYQKTGMVKYDAFREMSGALSYSIALLDQENSGVLVTSMYSREGCYSYAKEIIHGECKLNLSEEESEALKQAMEK